MGGLDTHAGKAVEDARFAHIGIACQRDREIGLAAQFVYGTVAGKLHKATWPSP
jgi:hypothetical protein